MRTFIVLLATVAVALADVSHLNLGYEHQIPIVHYLAQPQPQAQAQLEPIKTDNNGYHFGYELSDGQARQESAKIEVRGPEEAILRIQGSYSYVDPADGKTYTIRYIADDQGYRAEGAHIPVAPKVAGY